MHPGSSLKLVGFCLMSCFKRSHTGGNQAARFAVISAERRLQMSVGYKLSSGNTLEDIQELYVQPFFRASRKTESQVHLALGILRTLRSRAASLTGCKSRLDSTEGPIVSTLGSLASKEFSVYCWEANCA